MSKLKLTIERSIIESKEEDGGYCYIISTTEGEGRWLEIHGNMSEEQASGDYPLCLFSEKEIDEFAKKLKQILKSNQ